MKYRQRIVLIVTVIVVAFIYIYLQISLERNKRIGHKSNGHLDERNLETKDNKDHVTQAPNHVTEVKTHVTATLKTSPQTHVPSSLPSDFTKPWRVWSSWVQSDVLYSNTSFYSDDMNMILNAMSTYPVTSFDVGYKGTQLKASMYLKGNQKTVFKPMRYMS